MDLSMIENIVLFIFVVVLMTFFIQVLILKVGTNRKSYFSMIFSDKSFKKTRDDSLKAKKVNSPFIKENTIIETIKEGIIIIAKEGNVFEEVKEFDEKPKW